MATAAEVEAALEGLEPTGDLTVTRRKNGDHYEWQVCSKALFLRGTEKIVKRHDRHIQLDKLILPNSKAWQTTACITPTSTRSARAEQNLFLGGANSVEPKW